MIRYETQNLDEAAVKLPTISPGDQDMNRFLDDREIRMTDREMGPNNFPVIVYRGDENDLKDMIDRFWDGQENFKRAIS